VAGNRPISFEFLADVSQYLREVKGASVTTEDLADALVGVTESGDDLERKLGRSMRDAANDTEVLERAVRDVPKATDDMADKARRDFDRLGDDAQDAGQEVGQEFKQNLGESLASGDLEGLVTDTLGGLVASLKGPVGLVAGGIAAVAALAFTEIQRQAELTKAAIETLSAGVQDMYTQGIRNASRTQELQRVSQWLEDNTEKLRGFSDEAELIGVDLSQWASAIGTGGDALDEQEETLRQIIANNQIRTVQGDRISVRDNEVAAAARELLDFTVSTREETEGVAENMGFVAEATQDTAQTLGLVDTNMDGVIDDSDAIAGNMGTAAQHGQDLSQMDLNGDGAVDQADAIARRLHDAAREAALMRGDLDKVARLDFRNLSIAQQQAGGLTQAVGSAHGSQNRAG
jgi:methyl-accepting chemotaxis protein